MWGVLGGNPCTRSGRLQLRNGESLRGAPVLRYCERYAVDHIRPQPTFWSFLGGAFAPTLIHPEKPKLEPNEEDDGIYTSIPPLSPRSPWEEDFSGEESEGKVDYPYTEQMELPPNMDAPFEWEAPDLQEGREWYEDQDLVIMDAHRLLDSHRLNYTSQGAHRLEILWWECPPEHWESLCFGGSMSFMETPVPVLEENGKMTESQLTIAVAFVTELISLGVLALNPHGFLLMNVCTLFLVAKPGQPDQWRCIADTKKGHQHKSCASDPVHMTCPEDILPRMYPGGLASVIDAPTFFHMLLTVDEERRFMGLLHPDTGYHYWYTRLPVGSSNSPAVSGRFGAAFLRLIFQEVEEMQG
jgi:hypothetical protein